MRIGFCFIWVFAKLIYQGSLQATVEGVIGRSVLLQCSSTRHDLNLQDISVHWRHNGSKILCDIYKGRVLEAEQDHRYKKRAVTFPDEYQNGNFSIKLNNLQHTDAGKYICFITPSNKQQTVKLIINESTTEKRKPQNTGPHSGTSSPLFKVNTVFLLVILLVSVLCYLCLLPN